jgi:hypothetical protein
MSKPVAAVMKAWALSVQEARLAREEMASQLESGSALLQWQMECPSVMHPFAWHLVSRSTGNAWLQRTPCHHVGDLALFGPIVL